MDEVRNQSVKRQAMRIKPRVMAQACSMALAVLAAGYLPGAGAASFELDNGDAGQWQLGASVGGSWRTIDADKGLLSNAGGTGGTSGSSQDDGNLNYNKGNAYSEIAKLSGEVQLKHDNLGFVLGGKAWYDYAQMRKNVPHGSYNNAYVPNTELSDAGFYSGSTFSGASLVNAYVFGTFEPVEGKQLKVKLGNHVVNWGESLFVPGVNSFGAFDVAASRQAGSTVKDVLLPIPQLSANISIGGGVSLEGFYQIKWVRNVADGCGTFWSPADIYNCPTGSVTGADGRSAALPQGLSDRQGYNGIPVAVGPGGVPIIRNFRLGRGPETTGEDGGQFGLSAHWFADSVGTDFGAYFANYGQRTPILGLYKTTPAQPGTIICASPLNCSLWSDGVTSATDPRDGATYWDSSVKNIQTFGLSAATEIGGWALAGEITRTLGIPVQINGVDLLNGYVAGLGPVGAKLAAVSANPAVGSFFGGELKNKSQAQMSTIKSFPQLLGAESLNVVGEVAVQKWQGIGDPASGVRYGRGFNFGMAGSSITTAQLVGAKLAPAGLPASVYCGAVNKNGTTAAHPEYCSTQGFATTSAWGYRLLMELSYPNVFAGVNLKPKLFLSQDVHGYSADGIFSQGRWVVSPSLRADYLSKYYAQVTYTRYNHKDAAEFDLFHDRDNVSAVVGINF